jgi:hypothetical protein
MTKHSKLLAGALLGIGAILLGPAAQVATAQYPNPIVSSTTTTNWRWDPYQQRWVQDVTSTRAAASAYNPGRNSIVPGTYSSQTYQDGSRYITVDRWMGTDGQWHSNQTVVTPNATGGTTSQSMFVKHGADQPVAQRNSSGQPGVSNPRPDGRQDHRHRNK